MVMDLASASQPYRIKEDALNTFFFERDYEVYFMQLMRTSTVGKSDMNLVNAIASIHTGETLVPGTPDWNYEARQELGQQLLRKMAEDILRYYEITPVRQVDYSKAQNEQQIQILRRMALIDRPAEIEIKRLESRLELDGYKYKNGKLYAIESSVIPEEEEQSYLERLTSEVNLTDQNTVKHHSQLSEEHYLNGKWDDSISNSRKVLDSILTQVMEALYLKIEQTTAPAGLAKNAFQTRQYLERQGIVTTAEREALDKAYGVLSVTGGHPYIAEKDQARLMRHLSLTFSQFVLLRYQGYLTNNP
jgi:hypothetical protein